MDNEKAILDIKKQLSSYAEYLADKLNHAYIEISELQLLLKETDNFQSKASIFLSNKAKNISNDNDKNISLSFDNIKNINFKQINK